MIHFTVTEFRRRNVNPRSIFQTEIRPQRTSRAGVEEEMEPSEETQAYLKREFARFLEEQHGNVNYDKAIEELIARDDRRLPIDLNLLRSFDPDLANG